MTIFNKWSLVGSPNLHSNGPRLGMTRAWGRTMILSSVVTMTSGVVDTQGAARSFSSSPDINDWLPQATVRPQLGTPLISPTSCHRLQDRQIFALGTPGRYEVRVRQRSLRAQSHGPKAQQFLSRNPTQARRLAMSKGIREQLKKRAIPQSARN